MIKTIIKRSGAVEEFSATKLNGWGEWAASKLGRNVNWSEVVLHAVSTLPETCSSKELQECLIRYCIGKHTWEYNLMAGRLYAALLLRIIHDADEYPTIKQVHDRLINAGLMRKLDYTDEEYAALEKVINHDLNMKYPHYALHQNRKKYSLQDKTTDTEFETSQFIYMRMAMAVAEFEPKERRIKEVEAFYNEFANHKVNVPTPYYVNLGTKLSGFASCCVYTTKDTAKSLAAADHIAYMMTVMSAGIGYHLKSRSLGDPVRSGSIVHQGKIPYARSYVGALGANLQNGRGGAGTLYYNAFDPEVETLAKLKNPMTPLAKQVRGSDYSFGSNAMVVRKAARNEDIALFSYYHAPELYEAIYSGDTEEFERQYEEFLASDKPRKMMSARKIAMNALNEAYETGRHYEHFTDHLNAHTPFYDVIYSGNLCVSGDTVINYIDAAGEDHSSTIESFVENFDSNNDLYVESYDPITKRTVYNRVTDASLTAYSDASYTIIDNLGNTIECTPDHLVFTTGDKGFTPAKNLVPGDSLLVVDLDGELVGSHVVTVRIELFDTTDPKKFYDIKVENTECFFANNILVHNCAEIALPTAGFNTVEELYQDYNEELNFIEFTDTTGQVHNRYSFDRLETQRGNIPVKIIKVGDVIDGTITVEKIVQRSVAPEIALCNIGGIIVGNINNDKEHYSAAYRMLKVIKYGIENSEYVFKNLSQSAKARMNAGVGIVGLAHLMAKKKLSYSSQEGLDFAHELAESHYWHLANASLELSKEYGTAAWMYKTKWPEGWTPLSTYNKNVDELVTVENKRDWKSLSEQIVENGGILNSVLVAHMPAESCLKMSTKIKTLGGDMSLGEIFELTGADLEEEISLISPLTGGNWFDLKHPIVVETLAGQRPVSRIWLNGLSNYVTLTLEDGSTIDATHNHKFMTSKDTLEWKLVTDIIVGEYIDTVTGKLQVTAIDVSDDRITTMDIDVPDVHHYILSNGVVSHNSSISGATTNGIYPVRAFHMNKSNETMSISYVVPDSTKLKDYYEIAWDVKPDALTNFYAVIQKWTDQAISADRYRKIIGDEKVTASEMLTGFFRRHKYGVKQSYYQNVMTGKSIDLNASEAAAGAVEADDSAGCGSGGCSL